MLKKDDDIIENADGKIYLAAKERRKKILVRYRAFKKLARKVVLKILDEFYEIRRRHLQINGRRAEAQTAGRIHEPREAIV